MRAKNTLVAALLIAVGAVVISPRTAPAALDLDASITVNMPGGNGSYLTFVTSTHGLPGSVDTGFIGTGDGDACPAAVGPGYVCAHGFAHADFATFLAGTLPTPLPIGVLTLEAASSLHIHDAPAVSKYTVHSVAKAFLRTGCYAPSPAITGELILNIHFDGSRTVSTAPAGITSFVADYTNVPTFCSTGGGLCHASGGSLQCDGTLRSVYIQLNPSINIENSPSGLIGWNADIDLDASHTMTIESVDVVDDQQQPIPGARAWIADDNGQPAGYLLRSDEVGVVQPVTPTPTPSGGAGATPTPTATATPGGPACGIITKPKLGLGKMLPPLGDDTLAFAGTIAAPATLRDPDLGGLGIALTDGGGSVVAVTLPAGAYDKVAKTGWKVNRKRTTWTWTHPKAGAPAGILKAVVATKKTGVGLVLKGSGGNFAASAPLTMTVTFPLNGECVATAFGEPAQGCVMKSKGKTLVCK